MCLGAWGGEIAGNQSGIYDVYLYFLWALIKISHHVYKRPVRLKGLFTENSSSMILKVCNGSTYQSLRGKHLHKKDCPLTNYRISLMLINESLCSRVDNIEAATGDVL